MGSMTSFRCHVERTRWPVLVALLVCLMGLHVEPLAAAGERWDRLRPSGAAPPERFWASGVYDPVHYRMIVYCGVDVRDILTTREPVQVHDDVWILDLIPGREEWTKLRPTGRGPGRRATHTAIYDEAGQRMIVFGGWDTERKYKHLNDVWALDLTPGSEQWYQLAAYDVSRDARYILIGRPGTGKTRFALIVCSVLDRHLGDQVKLVSIEAADPLSKWVGDSEKYVRAAFETVRDRARDGLYTVLIWNEIDAFLRARGINLSTAVRDSVTTQPLCELDGLAQLNNFFVIATTNRPDLLDGALVREGRLGQMIEFRGPDWPEAEEIFRIHLRKVSPARGFNLQQLADRAAAHIFSPQRDGPPPVAVVRFHDGRRESVTRADVVTGAINAAACRRAAKRALVREWRGLERIVTPEDLYEALDAAFAGFQRRLTRENLRDHLGWPLDKAQEAVAVEPPPGAPLASADLFTVSAPVPVDGGRSNGR